MGDRLRGALARLAADEGHRERGITVPMRELGELAADGLDPDGVMRAHLCLSELATWFQNQTAFLAMEGRADAPLAYRTCGLLRTALARLDAVRYGLFRGSDPRCPYYLEDLTAAAWFGAPAMDLQVVERLFERASPTPLALEMEQREWPYLAAHAALLGLVPDLPGPLRDALGSPPRSGLERIHEWVRRERAVAAELDTPNVSDIAYEVLLPDLLFALMAHPGATVELARRILSPAEQLTMTLSLAATKERRAVHPAAPNLSKVVEKILERAEALAPSSKATRGGEGRSGKATPARRGRGASPARREPTAKGKRTRSKKSSG